MFVEGVRKTELLHNGHFANAVVWKHWMKAGGIVVEKDFSSRSLVIRNAVGRFLVGREVRFLREIGPLGIAPEGVERVGPFSMVEDYCEGVTLRDLIVAHRDPAKREREIAPADPLFPLLSLPDVSLFEKLERGVEEVHRNGVVHLDLHNARNIIRGAGDRWVVLDWQSALHTSAFPRPFREMLERIDLSGVYKHWEKLLPGTLGPERQRILDWGGRCRKLWVLRGLKIDAPVERIDLPAEREE